jgi:hypothetical protein
MSIKSQSTINIVSILNKVRPFHGVEEIARVGESSLLRFCIKLVLGKIVLTTIILIDAKIRVLLVQVFLVETLNSITRINQRCPGYILFYLPGPVNRC